MAQITIRAVCKRRAYDMHIREYYSELYYAGIAHNRTRIWG